MERESELGLEPELGLESELELVPELGLEPELALGLELLPLALTQVQALEPVVARVEAGELEEVLELVLVLVRELEEEQE